MKKWLFSLQRFFYPEICVVCDESLKRSEKSICIVCEASLPILPYAFYDGNPVEQLFYNRVKIEGASAFLNFIETGKTQKNDSCTKVP